MKIGDSAILNTTLENWLGDKIYRGSKICIDEIEDSGYTVTCKGITAFDVPIEALTAFKLMVGGVYDSNDKV